MRNLKKVLSLALVFVMVFALAVSAGAAYTDQSSINSDYKTAVDVLSAIKVMQGKASGQFDPKGNVTRAEMAKMIYVGSIGEDDGAALYASMATKFTDFTGADWAANYIKWANHKNIVAGTSATTFRPLNNVTGVQAAKMILTMMGFNADLEGYQNVENWEFNIADDARTFGLLDGLDYSCLGRALTREEAAKMIHNGLDKGIAVTYNDKGIGSYDTTASDMLTTVFGLQQADKVLTATATAGLTGPAGYVEKDGKPTTQESVIFGSDAAVKVKDGVTLDASLIGQNVVVYTSSKTNEVYAVAAKGDVVKATVAADTDTQKTVTAGAKIYVNNVSNDSANLATLAATDGVTLSYIGSEATASGVTTFTVKTVIVKQVAYGEATIADAKEDGKDIKTIAVDSTDNTFDIAATNVAKIDGAAAIATGDKVIVSMSKDAKGANVYAVSKVDTFVDGKITAISNKGVVTIAGKNYEVSTIAGTKGAGLTVAATSDANSRFYLYNGKIVEKTAVPGAVVENDKFALLLGVKNGAAGSDASGLDGAQLAVDPQAFMMTADGKIASYVVASAFTTGKVDLNKDLQTAYGSVTGTKLDTPVLVKYSMTADGKVNLGNKVGTATTVAAAADYNGTAVLTTDAGQYVVDKDTVFMNKTSADTAYPYTVAAAALKIKKSQAITVVADDKNVAKVIFINDANFAPAGATQTKLGVILSYANTADGIIVNMFDGAAVKQYATTLTSTDLDSAIAKLGAYTLTGEKLTAFDAADTSIKSGEAKAYVAGAYVTIDTTSYDLAADCALWTVDTKAETATNSADLSGVATKAVAVNFTLNDAGAVNAIYVIVK